MSRFDYTHRSDCDCYVCEGERDYALIAWAVLGGTAAGAGLALLAYGVYMTLGGGW